jgi:hypothetical protein
MKKNTVSFDRSLIAPCGINCGTCYAYLRDNNKCRGCWTDFNGKRITRTNCKIKNCAFLEKTISKFCYECEEFPCLRLKHIDKRYRTKYRASLIQNLETINKIGIADYLLLENEKWKCSNCGSTLSVHLNNCLVCGIDFNKMLS